jgi:hypothetical protein
MSYIGSWNGFADITGGGSMGVRAGMDPPMPKVSLSSSHWIRAGGAIFRGEAITSFFRGGICTKVETCSSYETFKVEWPSYF